MNDEQNQRYELLFYLPQRPHNFMSEPPAQNIGHNFTLSNGINFMYSQESRLQNGRIGPSAFFAYGSDVMKKSIASPGSLIERTELFGFESTIPPNPVFGLMCLLAEIPSNFLPEGVTQIPASSDLDITAYAISGNSREEMNRHGVRSIWASQRAAESFTSAYLPGFEVKPIQGKIVRLEDEIND